MTATTLDGVLLKGVAGSRPAANAVAKGTLYSATDTGAITQSDGVSTWSTYATITGASGSITASGYTQTTARLLGRTTASTGAIEEITVGSGLSLSAGSLTATGGSGITRTQLGTTSAGGSFDTTAYQNVFKKVTMSSAGLMASIGVFGKGDASHVGWLHVAVYPDTAGAPVNVAAVSAPAVATVYAMYANTTVRAIEVPIGYWAATGDYWIAAQIPNNSSFAFAYAGSGSDSTQAAGDAYFADSSNVSISTGTNNYSLYVNVLK